MFKFIFGFLFGAVCVIGYQSCGSSSEESKSQKDSINVQAPDTSSVDLIDTIKHDSLKISK